MAVDFQIIMPQEAITLTKIGVVPNFSPKTLEVIGQDFSSVDTVYINEIEAPEFIVLSKTKLLAQVPNILVEDRLTSVSVLSKRLTLTERSYLRFRIGNSPKKVKGILRLVQLFLKILFTTPGTDIFSKQLGGGALQVLGRNIGKDNGSDLISSFVISVDNTVRQIIGIQSRNSSLPPDERLLSAKVLKATFVKSETALVVTIEVKSQTGKPALVNLEL